MSMEEDEAEISGDEEQNFDAGRSDSDESPKQKRKRNVFIDDAASEDDVRVSQYV